MPLEQFGRYQIRSVLAKGGMAELFLADTDDGRTVVLKRIRPDHAADPDYREFFDHEARLGLLLDHPNVVHTLDTGEVEGVPYVAMEYVRGASVLDLIRRAIEQQVDLPVEAILSIGLDLCAALTYVHELRADGRSLDVIHRDVSPPNVVVGLDGRAHLVDFGVAKSTTQRHETAAGVIKGKVAYLAPEQLLTDSEGQLRYDHRADLFVLGTVLYELFTLRPLFRARTPEDTVRRVIADEVPPLDSVRPDVPAGVSQVVMRALAKAPHERYTSGRELAEDLRDAARAAGLVPSQAVVRAQLKRLLGADHPGDEATPTPVRRARPSVAVDEFIFDPLRGQRAPSPPTDPLRLAGGTGALARVRLEETRTPRPTGPMAPARAPGLPPLDERADTQPDADGDAAQALEEAAGWAPARRATTQVAEGQIISSDALEARRPTTQVADRHIIDQRPTTALFLEQLDKELATPAPVVVQARPITPTVMVAPPAPRRRVPWLLLAGIGAAVAGGAAAALYWFW